MKGYIYTLEVLIAISIIVISMVSVFKTAPTRPETEISIIKQNSFDALYYLDQEGSLKKMVLEDNETGIEDALKDLLSENIRFELDICSTECELLNLPQKETIVVVDYYVSSYKETYIGKRVRLFVWRKF
jgi:hypothetical protein